VTGLEARYPFTLQLDSSLTRSATPQMVPQVSVDAAGNPIINTAITNVTQTTFDTGLELKKHLPWGTDLSLRLDASRQTSTQFFFVGPGVPGANPDGTFTVPLGPGYGASVKLAATQPLLRGAGRALAEADLRIARRRLTGVQLNRDHTASEVLRDALTAYWELWYATTAVDIEHRGHDTAQKERDDAAARIRTGSLAAADGLTFETEVARRQEDVVNAEAERGRRAADLARLLGRAELPGLEAAVPEAPTDSSTLDGDLQSQALGASPKLRALAADVAVAETRATTAGDSLRPRLDLDGYVQGQGLAYDDVPEALNRLTKLKVVSAHVGLTLELPLDDTQHRAERERAQLEVETAVHRLEEERQEVLGAVESTRLALEEARQRVSLAGQTRDLALRQADAERARFATGGSTAIQVLQAQDAVRAAELRVARARTDVVQRHVALAHQVGLLLGEALRDRDDGVCALR
jgi:outer membrane protein